MISVTGDVRNGVKHLQVAAEGLEGLLDTAIEEELKAFIERLRPETPVRSGDMQKGYGIGHDGPGHFTLTDEMFYAGWVAYTGTPGGRMKPNPTLKRMIDEEDTQMALALEASMARMMGGG